MKTLTDVLLEQPYNLNLFFRLGFEGTNGIANRKLAASYRTTVEALRPHYGLAASASSPLLSKGDDNIKYAKASAYQVGLSLNPSTIRLSPEVAALATYKLGARRNFNACPDAGDCIRGCVSKAGQGFQRTVIDGRNWKTALLIVAPNLFMWKLGRELAAVQRKADTHTDANGSPSPLDVVCRLNTFSDVAWEQVCPSIFTLLPEWQFLDYTKSYDRADASVRSRLFPVNYRLAFSWSERATLGDVKILLLRGGNVSVVSSGTFAQDVRALFSTSGYEPTIVNADATDEWILEYNGAVGVLAPKGHKIKPLIVEESTFVITPVNIGRIG